MKELQKRQQLKRVLYSFPLLILLAVLTFFLVKGALSIMLVERKSANIVKKLETKASALFSREQELEDEIAFLNTEEGVLEEIRSKFSVTRKGERVAVIVEGKSATSSENTDESWIKKIWHAIMPRNDK